MKVLLNASKYEHDILLLVNSVVKAPQQIIFKLAVLARCLHGMAPTCLDLLIVSNSQPTLIIMLTCNHLHHCWISTTCLSTIGDGHFWLLSLISEMFASAARHHIILITSLQSREFCTVPVHQLVISEI